MATNSRFSKVEKNEVCFMSLIKHFTHRQAQKFAFQKKALQYILQFITDTLSF